MRTVHRPFLIPLAVLALAAALATAARAVTVEQIPSPRPAGWVVDLTATLSPEQIAQLNRLGDEVESQTGAQMAVVVVGSTEGAPSRDFATRLFNTWHLGNRQNNNGLLVFAALADHKAEIILGTGISGEARVRESEAVMQNEMVPRFRGGDPGGAVLHGAAACAKTILGADVAIQEPVAAVPAPIDTPFPVPPIPAYVAPVPSPAPFISELIPVQQPAAGSDLLWAALALAAGVAVAFKLRVARCPHCKEMMKETALDETCLTPAQQEEQRIGSVQYRLWVCPACGERTKTRRQRFFSGYGNCPSCSARTLETTRTQVEPATYVSDGSGRTDEVCRCCNYHQSSTYSIPMLVARSSSYSSDSSSSSSTLSSSSSFSDSSSSVSSSSSSDSGFSGGSSSGGGASGSW